MTALTTRLSRSARPTPSRRVSAPCRATIGHTASASTIKKSGYACGPALTRKMAWVALKAVYIAHPRRIAKPATCSVRSSSLRRTWRNRARSGTAVTLRDYGSLDVGFRPSSSLTVELMCATLADAVTTRLVIFVSNTQVADLTDPVSDLPRLGGLVVRGDDSGPTTVTATHFEQRDLTF